MVNVAEPDTRDATINLIAILGGIAALVALISIAVVSNVTHNVYEAGYYTISSLFDAVGVDEGAAFYAVIPQFSSQFYLLVGVSVLDGVVKIIIVGFVMAALVSMVSALGSRSILRVDRKVAKNHFIVCGYSSLAERVSAELQKKHTPFIIVDKNPAIVEMAREAGFHSILGDFTTTQGLRRAYIERAKGIMFLTPNDYENLLGVVTARHLNANLKIIARAEDDSSITKIHRAGAELCVVPEVLAGLELGEAIANRWSK